jgi:hypothetical protein
MHSALQTDLSPCKTCKKVNIRPATCLEMHLHAAAGRGNAPTHATIFSHCLNLLSAAASAAVQVRVGSMCDPPELPGLAHFCEHMLFYSSEKYPVEDEYSRWAAVLVAPQTAVHIGPVICVPAAAAAAAVACSEPWLARPRQPRQPSARTSQSHQSHLTPVATVVWSMRMHS